MLTAKASPRGEFLDSDLNLSEAKRKDIQHIKEWSEKAAESI